MSRYIKVLVSRECVALFNAQFPCSPLSTDRHYWFEFAPNGDLVDHDVPEHSDGTAALALSQDCAEYAESGAQPDWAIGAARLKEI